MTKWTTQGCIADESPQPSRLGTTPTIGKVIKMVTGVVVPHDDNLPLELREFGGLADYQQAVGGSVEAVDLDSPATTLFVNDEGKIHGMPVNRRATLLAWLTNRYLRRSDVICGSAVLVGPPDEFGCSQRVPADFLALLLETKAYAAEVQTVDNPNTWSRNLITFDDFWQAAAYALSLAERWLAVTQIRVVAVN